MSFRSLATALAVATATLAPQALAASSFSPAAPLPFELVNLRTTVDSCAFNAETVRVLNTGTAIQVRMRDNNCLVPGVPKEVDIRLGAFPVNPLTVQDLGDAHLQFDMPAPEGAPAGLKWGIVTYRLPNGGTVGRYITRQPL